MLKLTQHIAFVRMVSGCTKRLLNRCVTSCRSELVITVAPIAVRAAFSNIHTWTVLKSDMQLAGQVGSSSYTLSKFVSGMCMDSYSSSGCSQSTPDQNCCAANGVHPSLLLLTFTLLMFLVRAVHEYGTGHVAATAQHPGTRAGSQGSRWHLATSTIRLGG